MAATSFVLLPYVSRSLRRRLTRAGLGILFLCLALKGMQLRSDTLTAPMEPPSAVSLLHLP